MVWCEDCGASGESLTLLRMLILTLQNISDSVVQEQARVRSGTGSTPLLEGPPRAPQGG